MPTQTVTYRLDRTDGIEGFMAQQRASTDALNALEQWQAQRSGRCYKVLEDEDDFVLARLTVDNDDADAGDDLAKFARVHGLAGLAA